MSNSPLVNYTRLTSKCNKPRNHAIDTITIHHMAGNLTVEQCVASWINANRDTSSNYAIGTDGRIGMYVEEKDRSFCSSSAANDNRAITIEVANCTGAPNWEVSTKAMESLIALCADICRRNNIPRLNYTGDKSGNITLHKWFTSTACPGPYLESKMPEIAQRVNDILTSDSTANHTFSSEEQFIEQIADAVNMYRHLFGIEVASPIIAQACLESAFGTSDKAAHNNFFGLKFRPGRVDCYSGVFTAGSQEQSKDGSYTPISTDWYAFKDIDNGVLGYFQFISIDRYRNLVGIKDPRLYLETIKADGYATSLSYVDNLMNVIETYGLTRFDGASHTPAKTINDIAHEVLDGKWGNGDERKRRLSAAGYDYDEVQTAVTIRKNGSITATLPILKSGNVCRSVAAMQSMLTLHHHSVVSSGVFNANTENALKNFQKEMGLDVDGVCGNLTWAALLGI